MNTTFPTFNMAPNDVQSSHPDPEALRAALRTLEVAEDEVEYFVGVCGQDPATLSEGRRVIVNAVLQIVRKNTGV